MIMFPDFLFIDDSSVEFNRPDNLVRAEMGNGVFKSKVKQTIPTSRISFDVYTKRGNLGLFNKWLASLNWGADHFLMRSLVNGEIKKFRFIKSEFTWSSEGNLITTKFELEYYGD